MTDFGRRTLRLDAARHHQLVNSKLEAIERGEIRRLMLFMPPGHAKSTWASWLFPGWYLGRNPEQSLIATSHTGEFATRWGRKVRNLFMMPEWPFETQLAPDSQAAHQWETDKGGEYFAVGVGGAVTGRRADLAIIDDPLKGREDADSQVVRDKLWDWYVADLMTRLKPGGKIILIQTRWHEDDLAGRLLPEGYTNESGNIIDCNGEGWDVVCLPAVAEPNDLLGRPIGEALWPEWFPLDTLEMHRARSERNWSALYQQRPSPEEGDYFRRDWLRWYDNPPVVETLRIYGASDYAVTAKGGDYTVHGVFGVNANDDLFVLDWWRAQTDTAGWIDRLIHLIARWRPVEWAEEKGQIEKSVGPFIEKRMREAKVYCVREQYPSVADKPTRAQSIRGRMSQGKVYVPRNAPWIDDLVSELMTFPNGAYDDQVDVLSLFGRLLDHIAAPRRDKPPPRAIGGYDPFSAPPSTLQDAHDPFG